MAGQNTLKNLSLFLAAAAFLLCSLTMSHAAAAQAVATSPYQLSVFAKSESGYSQPDSIVQWRDSILVGFGNHVAKDGSDGKSSTIVEYSLTGEGKRTFSVPGHNDGLRIVGENNLWSLQNEDGNPNLAVINLESGRMTQFSFAPTVHGGGYDDMVVKNGQVFMSASNPNVNPQGVNVFPALVRARLSGSMVTVDAVMNGNANATDIPSGTMVQLNLTDPDSMTIDPRGNIVLDSQADGELVFIRHPLSSDRQVGRLLITKSTGGATTVDDTAFAPRGSTFMLFTDLAGDTVYRLDSAPFGFEPGVAYSASDTDGLLGMLNLDNGVVSLSSQASAAPAGYCLYGRIATSARSIRMNCSAGGAAGQRGEAVMEARWPVTMDQ